ncbi:MAG: NADPH:quinone reductase [Alphaproteobacteria bacterium]|nr:NADPH:quinone reductase [Alphaproteobacteria bacterium]
MKAIRIHEFGEADVLSYEDVPDPVAGPGEAVVAVKAVGVNPVETYIRAGIHLIRPELPFIPGSDAAGVVLSVGDGVGNLKPGDLVLAAGCMGPDAWEGAYAEQLLRRAEDLLPLPDNLSFAQGAALGVPYGTAQWALMRRGRAQAGETVLIHGASGAVGTAALQIATAHGITTIGTAGSERGLDLVRQHGAAHALDHTKDGYLDAVAELTDGKGPQIILEMLANVNLARDMEVVAKYGRIVIIGNRGPIEINAREAMMKELDLIGIALPNATAGEMAEIHDALGKGLADGSLDPVIGKELPLAEAIEAHHAVLRPGAYGKIVLIP